MLSRPRTRWTAAPPNDPGDFWPVPPVFPHRASASEHLMPGAGGGQVSEASGREVRFLPAAFPWLGRSCSQEPWGRRHREHNRCLGWRRSRPEPWLLLLTACPPSQAPPEASPSPDRAGHLGGFGYRRDHDSHMSSEIPDLEVPRHFTKFIPQSCAQANRLDMTFQVSPLRPWVLLRGLRETTG